MNKRKQLANLIFKEDLMTIEELERMYPKRNLLDGQMVTRFAPSPTGFLHTGSLYTALICSKFAKDTNGIFYLRIEDTDTKREIEGSKHKLCLDLKEFDIYPNELEIDNEGNSFVYGSYGPYLQSKRSNIYKSVIKEMIINDLAYPCFCTVDELNNDRTYQKENKEDQGYYGKYARCKTRSVDECIKLIERGIPYIIRFNSKGSSKNKIDFIDEVKGKLKLTENQLDIVILKSDGLPTYHFAHVVDDHFMRTTHVIRGEEWLSSLPIHYQLFETLNFEIPKYAHIPLILKSTEKGKRKLSKRKDQEASTNYFVEKGYPKEAIIEYLITLANTNFHNFRMENPGKPINEFKLSFNNMSSEGPLFDLNKLNDISKDIIASMDIYDLFRSINDYSYRFDKKLFYKISSSPKYFIEILKLDRCEKIRKDYYKYEDLYNNIKYLYDDEYYMDVKNGYKFNKKMKRTIIYQVIDLYRKIDIDLSSSESWFNQVKVIAGNLNFATTSKDVKDPNHNFEGSIVDFTQILRVSITNKENCPSLYNIIKIIGKERLIQRLTYAINYLMN